MISKKNATKTISVLLSTLLFSACSDEATDNKAQANVEQPPALSTTKIADIIVTNPSSFSRDKQPVYLSYYDLGLSADDEKLEQLVVTLQNVPVASQAIDSDYDGINDGLFFDSLFLG